MKVADIGVGRARDQEIAKGREERVGVVVGEKGARRADAGGTSSIDRRGIDEGSGGYPEDTPEETDPQDEGRDAGEEDV